MLQTKYDLLLYTDGSGHEDTYGGYSAYVTTPNKSCKRFCMGAMSATSVDRAEFTAFIEGLRLCLEVWSGISKTSLRGENEDRPKPKVHWFSDRESLVLSVRKVYARENCPDLWRAFEYYEDRMDIDATAVTEPFTETEPEFVEVDLRASTGREIIKHYFLNTPLHIDYVPKIKKSKANSS